MSKNFPGFACNTVSKGLAYYFFLIFCMLELNKRMRQSIREWTE